ncbi:hypothetical protein Lal_00009845 [Lupinus albus]|uniref:Putative ribonuclease P n=1 Tax=Lupinus albus TaxID=3870 RepID=A0A6A5LCV4_LUPAL|nr:putative ribonuclease P [Lupinus albus]KAF1859261.1 hypothetical protein Lal_00009845 [Lupinus albus]
MGYMDLNIPYPEPSGPNKKSTIDSNRTKIAVKAMELGYTGIAYNRTITGVMSDQHLCSISPLTITSLFKLLPALSSSAKLHRDLLGIPISTPFRQYTRLTVCVDSGPQCQAINSGNPILKTYDLVAVKPLNQSSFDLACEKMEVDIISIDFSMKLPFRLKQHLIKAAVQRGVHFEVTYACLITDIQSRKQLITNAKLLMDWTRGRNIVFSSEAPSVNEFRGPLDVANLLSLLGLSKDRAKEAISKNCRILLANSLKKKQFYKEAIRVEVLSSDVASHSKEGWYQELLKWDPISSGEGDILLDDLTKSLSTSYETPKPVKAINFDSIPSQGFQVKDFLPASNVFDNSTELPNRLDACPEPGEISLSDAIATHQVVSHDTNRKKNKRSRTKEALNLEEIDTPTNTTKLESKIFIDSDVNCTPFATKAHVSEPDLCISSNVVDTVTPCEDKKLNICSEDVKLDDAHNVGHKVEIFTPDSSLNAQMERMHETFPKENLKIAEHGVLEISTSISENLMDDEQFKECKTDAVELNEIPLQTPDDMKMKDDSTLATHLLPNAMLEDTKLGNTSTGSDLVASVKSGSAQRRVKRKKRHLARMHETFPEEDLKISEHGVLKINTSISENIMDGDKCKTDAVEINEIPRQKPDEKKIEDCSTISLPDGMLVDTEVGKESTVYELVPSVMSRSAKKRAKRKKVLLAGMHETFPKEDLKVAEHGVSEINTSISENLMDVAQFNKCKTDAVELCEIPQQKPDEKKMEDYSTLLLPDGMLKDTELGKVSTGCELVPSVKSRSAKKRANRKKDHGVPDSRFDTQLLNPVPVAFKKRIKKKKSKPEIN